MNSFKGNYPYEENKRIIKVTCVYLQDYDRNRTKIFSAF